VTGAGFSEVDAARVHAEGVGAYQSGITIRVGRARSASTHIDPVGGGEPNGGCDRRQECPARRSTGNGEGKPIDGMSGHPKTFLSHEDYNRTCRLEQES
jgi:hypothetical protein